MELKKIKTTNDLMILPSGLINISEDNFSNDIITIVCNGLYNYIGKHNLLLLKQIEEFGAFVTDELTKVASLYERKNAISESINKTNEALISTHGDIELQKEKLLETINDLFTKNNISDLEKSHTLCSLELEKFTSLLKSRIVVEKSKNQMGEDFDFSSSEMTSTRSEIDQKTAKLKKLIIEYLEFETNIIYPIANLETSAIDTLLTNGEKATNTTNSNIVTKASPIISLLAKRFQLFMNYVKLLQRLIEEYQLKKIIKSDVIKTKKILKQITMLDTHMSNDLGVKIIYTNMPEKLSKQDKNAISFYTSYIERLFKDNCPSIDSKVVKTQTKDKFTNAVAVAINSLSLLF